MTAGDLFTPGGGYKVERVGFDTTVCLTCVPIFVSETDSNLEMC